MIAEIANRKAALKAPRSRRFAKFGNAWRARQRLDCGAFSAAFPLSSPRRSRTLKHALFACLLLPLACRTNDRSPAAVLLDPDAPQMNRRAPELFRVRFETSKGDLVIEVHRDWSPHG